MLWYFAGSVRLVHFGPGSSLPCPDSKCARFGATLSMLTCAEDSLTGTGLGQLIGVLLDSLAG